jgi:hypothetical protein
MKTTSYVVHECRSQPFGEKTHSEWEALNRENVLISVIKLQWNKSFAMGIEGEDI